MNVVNKPDILSLTGNINPFVVATTKELTFVLKKGDEQILSQSFNPGTSGSVTIKIGDILNNQLSFTLKEATSYYLQNSIFATFTATLTDSDGSTDITFVAIRSGVSQLSDTPSEFLKCNFLTWQPTVKKVTYYTPEYLTYYAVVPGKMQIKATYQDATSETKTIVSMDAGTAVTVPLQYGIVYGMFGKLPAFYDVWYEDASGNVLSYIQRYVADNAKSENEQWVLFTNSLGGVDTFRAYGEEEFTGEHTHNLVEIDDTNEEYRVDTVSKHKKYTGHLTTYERQWMQDFFPSLNKFIYSNGEARKIVIIESEDTYNDLDQVGGFSFTYKYTETDAYLNLQRNTQLPKDLNIDVPDLANFTLPPRLLEFPTLSGSEGVLFPAQKTFADKWGKISLDDIAQFTIDSLLASDIAKKWTATSGSSHSHDNKSILDSITEDLIKKWNSTNGNSHSHDNKSFLDQIDQNLSTKDSPTFESLKIGSGVLKWDNTHKSFYIEQADGTPANFYATGGVSSYGAASESSPGSGIDETTLWSIMSNTGTQQIAANHLATALSAYVTQSSMSALLANYAPVNHGHVWGDITDRPASLPASDVYTWAKAATKPSYAYSEITDKPVSLPASDVYAWAKAATKPSYAYSEITDKPSTLSGYGITDAAAKSHSHAWADITDRPTKLSQFTNDMISTWALAASKPSYTYSEITGCPTSLPASDVYAWAKAASKPSYSYSEISGTPDLSSLHTHSNKELLDAINQNLSSTGTPLFSRITIGAISLLYDSVNNSLYVQKSDGSAANFYATGGVSSYGAGAVSGGGSGIDETTLWSIMGNTGTQQIAANHLATALSPYVTQISLSAMLANYAPLVHGHVWGDITDRPSSLPASDVYSWAKAATKPSYAYSEITDKPASLPASDVYAWAKASNKPSYAYSEITDKPSTLGGYGITDAASVTSLANYRPVGGVWPGANVPGNREFGFITNDGTGEIAFKSYNGTMNMIIDGDIYCRDSSYIVWHAGNDGSGSGLDADLLDGIDGDGFMKNLGSTGSDSLNSILRPGNYYISDQSGGRPCTYGALLTVGQFDTRSQLALGYKNDPGMWYRGYSPSGSNWDYWHQVAFTDSNVASATKLNTARSITIGNTAKSFDGTYNVSWSLSEIGAAAAIHSHTISQISDIGNASVNYAASAGNANNAFYLFSNNDLNHTGVTVKSIKDLLASKISSQDIGIGFSYILGGECIRNWSNESYTVTDSNVYAFVKIGGGYSGSTYGQWLLSSYDLLNIGVVGRDGNIWSDIKWLAYTTDNVASATKLQTARSFTIGNTGKSFDGTYNIFWSLSEIGAAAAIHSHTISQLTDIGNASVNYAASAGNTDTVDSVHASQFLRCDSASSNNPINGNFAIGNASGRNFIQSHSGQPLDINPLGNAVTINGTQAVTNTGTWGISITGNAYSSTKLQMARKIYGQTFDATSDVDGTLSVKGPVNGNWSEGIRIHEAENGWNTLIFCGSDNTGDSGTSTNSWSFHTNSGNFMLGHNGTNNVFSIDHNNNMGIGTATPAYKLHVSGNGYFSDALNLAATLSAAGLITANGNIKSANYIEIGSTGIRLMYDSTNDCLKLIKSDGSAVNLLVTGGVTAFATA